MAIREDYWENTFSTSNRHLIKPGDLAALTDFLNAYQFNPYGANEVLGKDGVTVDGAFDQEYTEKKFSFWSPHKGSPDAKLTGLLFNIMQNAFTADQAFDSEFYSYIKRLKTYFHFFQSN